MVLLKMVVIFKICAADEWQTAVSAGFFDGSPVDKADGFIHLSTRDQVAETARRHFAEKNDLVLLAIDPRKLNGALKWEPSRGGDLFPHHHGLLPVSAVIWMKPLPWREGVHEFPGEVFA